MTRLLLSRLLLAAGAVVALTGAASAKAPPATGPHGSIANAGSYHATFYHSSPHPYSGYQVYHNYGARPFYGPRVLPYYGYGYAPYSYGSGIYPYSYGYGSYPYSWSYPMSGGYLMGTPDTGLAPAASPPAAPATDPGDTGSAAPADTKTAAVSTDAKATADRTTHLTVRLPAGAELWVEWVRMSATGDVREFDTPPLAAGRQYAYEIHARWTDRGLLTDQTQKVVFSPGDRVVVTFPTPAP